MKNRSLSPLRLGVVCAVVVFVLASLLVLTLGPERATAGQPQPRAADQLHAAWQRAQQAGAYRFTADVQQTLWPRAVRSMIGQPSQRVDILVQGEVDSASDAELVMTTTNAGQASAPVRLVQRAGQTFVEVNGELKPVANPMGTTAPGGDYLGYLSAATNVRELPPQTFDSSILTGYAFDIDGARWADYVTKKLARPGQSVVAAPALKGLRGQGELWIDANGLPRRQVLDLELPGVTAQYDASNHTVVEFREFANAAGPAGAASSTPTPLAALPRLASDAARTLLPLLGILLATALVILVYRKHPRLVYTAIAGATALILVVTPVLQAAAQAAAPPPLNQVLQDAVQPGAGTDATAPPVTSRAPTQDVPACGDALPGVNTDGDSLDDRDELCLGTSIYLTDTDQDTIPDDVEVAGFDFGGTTWYSDPLAPDSNLDGLLDSSEYPTADGGAAASWDPDGDGIPNVWDTDDDGDQVPDVLDIAPYASGNFVNSFDFSSQGDGSGAVQYIDLQLRTNDPEHLRFTTTPLDWPDSDGQGTIKDLNSSKDDVLLVPMLAIQSNTTPEAALARSYGIGLFPNTDPETGETDLTYPHLLYVPLQAVEDDGQVVGFQTRVAFDPGSQADVRWRMRMIWLAQGSLDEQTWRGVEIVQSPIAMYPEDSFRITGLQVMKTAGYENAILSIPSLPNDDRQLFQLMFGLNASFLNALNMPEQDSGETALHQVYDLFTQGINRPPEDKWGIAANVRVDYGSYAHRDAALAAQHTTRFTNFMQTYYGSSNPATTAALVFAYEETLGSVTLDNLPFAADGSIAVNLANIQTQTRRGAFLQTFERSDGEWIGITFDRVSEILAERYTNITTLLADLLPTYPELTERDVLSVLLVFYLSWMQGKENVVKIFGQPVVVDSTTMSEISALLASTQSDLPGYLIEISPFVKPGHKIDYVQLRNQAQAFAEQNALGAIPGVNISGISRGDPLLLAGIGLAMDELGVDPEVKQALKESALTSRKVLTTARQTYLTWRSYEEASRVSTYIAKGGVVSKNGQQFSKVSLLKFTEPIKTAKVKMGIGPIAKSGSHADDAVSKTKVGGRALGAVFLVLEVAFIWTMIGLATDWDDPQETQAAVSYGIVATALAVTLFVLSLNPIGAIFVLLFALADMLVSLFTGTGISERFITALASAFYDYEVLTWLDSAGFVGMRTGLDDPGDALVVGNRYLVSDYFFGKLVPTDDGGGGDLNSSWARGLYEATANNVPGVVAANDPTNCVREGDELECQNRAGVTFEPQQAGVNIPIEVRSEIRWRYRIEECKVGICDKSGKNGDTIESDPFTAFLDVLPATVDDLWSWQTTVTPTGGIPYTHIFNPIAPPADDTDEDGDGLTARAENRLGTSPRLADSDEDGLGDGTEVFRETAPATWQGGWDVTLPSGTIAHVFSNPQARDADGDGLRDLAEQLNASSPHAYNGAPRLDLVATPFEVSPYAQDGVYVEPGDPVQVMLALENVSPNPVSSILTLCLPDFFQTTSSGDLTGNRRPAPQAASCGSGAFGFAWDFGTSAALNLQFGELVSIEVEGTIDPGLGASANGIARSALSYDDGDPDTPVQEIREQRVVYVDNEVPTVTFAEPANNALLGGGRSAVTLRGTANDSTSWVDEVEILGLPGGTVTAEGADRWAYEWPIALDGSDDGSYTLSARATDHVGRVSSDATIDVIVDNTPPTVSISAPTDGQIVGSQDSDTIVIALSGSASDATGGVARVQISLDNRDWQEVANTGGAWGFSWEMPDMISAQGEHRVRARAFDAAGNLSAVASRTFIVDVAAPSSDLTNNTYVADPPSVPANQPLVLHGVANEAGNLPLPARPALLAGDLNAVSDATIWLEPDSITENDGGLKAAWIGDFNGDRLADLVMGLPASGSGGSGKVSVIYGKLGGWQIPPDQEAIADSLTSFVGAAGAGLGLSLATASDVNGDGRDDLVVGDPTNNRAFLILGRANPFGRDVLLNGPGTSISVFVTPGGTTLREVVSAGDVNGDGYGDLFALVDSRAYLHLGSAAWTQEVDVVAEALVAIDLPNGSARVLAVGNTDDEISSLDNFDDFVVMSSGGLQLYKGTGLSAGLPLAAYPGTPVSVTGGNVTYAAGLGDVDADGQADFAFASGGSVKVVSGAGLAQTTLSGISSPSFVAGVGNVRDITGDPATAGRSDVLVGDGSNASLFLGGALSGTPAALLTGVSAAATAPVANGADMNGDGSSDLLLVSTAAAALGASGAPDYGQLPFVDPETLPRADGRRTAEAEAPARSEGISVVTRHVDDDYCTTCTNGGNTWGTTAFATIGAAITAAAGGDTIQVHAGVYPAFTVDTKNDLTIRGDNPDTVFVDGAGGAFAAKVQSATGVRLEKLSIGNATNAVQLTSAGVGGYDNSSLQTVLDRLFIHDFSMNGLFMDRPSTATFQRSTLVGASAQAYIQVDATPDYNVIPRWQSDTTLPTAIGDGGGLLMDSNDQWLAVYGNGSNQIRREDGTSITAPVNIGPNNRITIDDNDDLWLLTTNSTGFNGPVYAVEWVSDSEIYIGGQFTMVGGVTLSPPNIAKWDGTNWRSLGTTGIPAYTNFPGVPLATVYAIEKSTLDGPGQTMALYVGGAAPSIGTPQQDYTSNLRPVIWRYVNGQWSAVAQSNGKTIHNVSFVAANDYRRNTIYAIAPFENAEMVLVGGSFHQLSDGTEAGSVAVFDTQNNANATEWKVIGGDNKGVWADAAGNNAGTVYAVENEEGTFYYNGQWDSSLYIGGDFRYLWNGSSRKEDHALARIIVPRDTRAVSWAADSAQPGTKLRGSTPTATPIVYAMLDNRSGAVWIGGSGFAATNTNNSQMLLLEVWDDSLPDGSERVTNVMTGGGAIAPGGTIRALAFTTLSAVMAGGTFTDGGNTRYLTVGNYGGGNYTSNVIAQGPNSTVYALDWRYNPTWLPYVLVGGDFTTAAGQTAQRVGLCTPSGCEPRRLLQQRFYQYDSSANQWLTQQVTLNFDASQPGMAMTTDGEGRIFALTANRELYQYCTLATDCFAPQNQWRSHGTFDNAQNNPVSQWNPTMIWLDDLPSLGDGVVILPGLSSAGNYSEVVFRYINTTFVAWANLGRTPDGYPVGVGASLTWDGGSYVYLLPGGQGRKFLRRDISDIYSGAWSVLGDGSAACALGNRNTCVTVGFGGAMVRRGTELLMTGGGNTTGLYRYGPVGPAVTTPQKLTLDDLVYVANTNTSSTTWINPNPATPQEDFAITDLGGSVWVHRATPGTWTPNPLTAAISQGQAAFLDPAQDIYRVTGTSAAALATAGYHTYAPDATVAPTCGGANCYTSLQAALDSGANQVVVQSGTYAESVSLPNGLTVIGAGAGTTVLSGTGQRALVSAEGVSRVALSGLSLEGDGTSHGLVVENGAGPVTASRLLIRDTNTAILLDGATTDLVTFNNTIVNNTDGLAARNHAPLDVRNTIFAHNSGDGLRYQSNAATTLHSYNLYWANGQDIDDGTANPAVGADELFMDPLFVDAGQDDYRILDASPAIDAGDPGDPAPPGAGNRVDIGYLEQGRASIYVDPAYCATCANDGLSWGVDAFATIQAALNEAATQIRRLDAALVDPYLTVAVAPGTYNESVSVPSYVDLVGSGPDQSTIVAVTATDAVSFNGVVDASITGFQIRGAGSGRAGIAVLNASNHIRIERNLIKSNYDGVSFASGATGDVQFNTIAANSHDGVASSGNGSWLTVRNNVVVFASSAGVRTVSGGKIFNDYNLFFGNGSNYIAATGSGLAQAAHEIVGSNPQLTGDGLYRPTATSPALDAAEPRATTPAGGGTRADLGYYELLAAPVSVFLGDLDALDGNAGVAGVEYQLVYVADPSQPLTVTVPTSWQSTTPVSPGQNVSFWQVSPTPAQEGLHRIYSRASDSAGNTMQVVASLNVTETNRIYQTWYAGEFLADSTDPVVAWSPVPGSGPTPFALRATVADSVAGQFNVARVAFELTGTGCAPCRVEASWAPVPWGGPTQPRAFQAWLGNTYAGAYSVIAVATDRAGNRGESAAANINVSGSTSDTTPPTLAVTAPAANTVVPGTVEFAGTASDNSGTVASVEVSVDGGFTWLAAELGAANAWSLDWTPNAVLEAVSFPVRVRASDPVGNQANASLTVTVDNRYPRLLGVTSSSPPGSHLASGGTVNLNATGDSPNTGSTLTLSWTSLQDGSGAAEAFVVVDEEPDTTTFDEVTNRVTGNSFTTTLDPGTWYLHLFVRDVAGNVAVSHFGPWYVDRILLDGLIDRAASEWHVASERMDDEERGTSPQELFVTWDADSFFLGWQGALWEIDGTLWAYLSAGGGGTTSTVDGQRTLPFSANYAIEVNDAETGTLWTYNGGWQDGLLDFGHNDTAGTEVRLPFGANLGGPVSLLAFAEDNGAVTSIFPTTNSLNGPWNSNYHWNQLAGTVPNANQPTALSVVLKLTSAQDGTASWGPGETLNYTAEITNREDETLSGLALALSTSSGLSLQGNNPIGLNSLASGAGQTVTFDATLAGAGALGGITDVTLTTEVMQGSNPLNQAAYTHRVDATPPTVEIGNKGTTTVNTGLQGFVGSASDGNGAGVALVEVSTNGSAWQPASGTTVWAFQANVAGSSGDSFTVSARATDAAGNQGAPESVTFTIDTTAPGIAFDTLPAVINTLFASIGGVANDPATLARVDVQIDNGEWLPANSLLAPDNTGSQRWRFTWDTPVEDGVQHQVRARAVDLVGNTSPSIQTSVVVDIVPPTLAVTEHLTEVSLGYYRPGQVTGPPVMRGTVADGGGLGQVIVLVVAPDGASSTQEAALANGAWAFTPELQPQLGEHRLTAYGIDAAGNVTPARNQTTVVLLATNTPPEAEDDTCVIVEDTADNCDVLANDDDADDDPLNIESVEPPAHGTTAIEQVNGQNGTYDVIRYTPAANYNGPDQFTYTITDNNDDFDTAMVVVTVQPANDQPVLTGTTTSVDEGATTTIGLDPLVVDVETADADITWLVTAGNGGPVASLTIDATTRQAVVTGLDGPGSVAFTLTATDRGDPDGCTAAPPDCSPALTASVDVTVDVNNTAPQVDAAPGAQTLQYSDRIVDVLVSGRDATGDTLSAATSWNFNGGGFTAGLPGQLTLTANTCTPDSNPNRTTCTWTLAGPVTVAPGVYVVRVVIGDGEGGSSATDVTLTVNREDARSTYTGPMLVATGCATCSTATIPLRATIQDITAVVGDPVYDPSAGVITNANVTFVNRDAGNAVLCSTNTIVLIDPADPTTGSATCNVTVDIGNADGNDYTLGTVVGGWYLDDRADENALISVFKPSTKFITGGGYLFNQGSAGQYAGDPGLKTHFGFNFKYTAQGRNPKGRLNVLVRKGGRVYQFKSTSITSVAVIPYDPNNASSGRAEVIGKANLQDITDPSQPISLGGNAAFNLVVKDNGEAGQPMDTLALTVWSNGGGLWYSSSWSGTATVPKPLDAGNVQVR